MACEQMNQHGLSPTLIWATLLEFIGILFIHTLGELWVLSKPQQGNTEEKGTRGGGPSPNSRGFQQAPEVGS